MNTYEYQPSVKEIEFYETEIMPQDSDDPFCYDGHLPGWAKYTAVDLNGDIYCYQDKPIVDKEYWILGDDEHYTLERVEQGTEYCPDWKDSLREV